MMHERRWRVRDVRMMLGTAKAPELVPELVLVGVEVALVLLRGLRRERLDDGAHGIVVVV
jgi:hypothetical protein